MSSNYSVMHTRCLQGSNHLLLNLFVKLEIFFLLVFENIEFDARVYLPIYISL